MSLVKLGSSVGNGCVADLRWGAYQIVDYRVEVPKQMADDLLKHYPDVYWTENGHEENVVKASVDVPEAVAKNDFESVTEDNPVVVETEEQEEEYVTAIVGESEDSLEEDGFFKDSKKSSDVLPDDDEEEWESNVVPVVGKKKPAKESSKVTPVLGAKTSKKKGK